MAIGPGISTNEDTATLVKQLLTNVRCPMVLDADAITAVSQDPTVLRKVEAPLVLTPHPGEMARLCHSTVADVQRNRLESAQKFSSEYGVVLVLKGHRTIIASPDGRLAINSTGNPAMASGETGDTLRGLSPVCWPRALMPSGPHAFRGLMFTAPCTTYSTGFEPGASGNGHARRNPGGSGHLERTVKPEQ